MPNEWSERRANLGSSPRQLRHDDKLSHRRRRKYFFQPRRNFGSRSEHAGAAETLSIGTNQHLALVGRAGRSREPFAIKLGLVHQHLARVPPRILLAVGNIDHAAVDDAVARGVLAGGLERSEVDAYFPPSADAREP